jgi:uncharacterized protein YhdP
VKTKVTGGTIDFAEGWPPISGIDGEAVFRGNRMDAHAQAGVILGVQLSDVKAAIAELGKHQEHLLIKGTAQGATAKFLHFAAVSPLARA